MELTDKYYSDLTLKIQSLEELILEGSAYEDSDGIALEYVSRVSRLKGLKEALEIFKHTIKTYSL